MDDSLACDRFPRASRYNPAWLAAAVSGGANPLWLTEWLAEAMDLRPGMRVLEIGCGRAASSVFLRREFGVEVWATDLWFSATENLQRIRDAGVADGVFPLHTDARDLPFADGFFDALISIDAFPYFGTDDTYLAYAARFVKTGGLIAMAGAGLVQELGDDVPGHLAAWWTPDMWCLHSPGWWRTHWARTQLVAVEQADTMPDGWRRWIEWHQVVAPDNRVEIDAVAADRGRHLAYVRVVSRRSEVATEERIVSVPTQYTPAPLLRDEG